MVEVAIGCWLVLAAAAGAHAAERGRSGLAWFGLALVVSLPACLVLIAVTRDPRRQIDPRRFRAAILARRCPRCRRLAPLQAAACARCGAKLPR